MKNPLTKQEIQKNIMKNVLGLDLGTNSIGWALVQLPEEENVRPNIRMGSRILPMSQDVLSKF